MALSLKPSHIARYGEIGRVLWKYGDRDLLRSIGLEEVFRDSLFSDDDAVDPSGLADDLRALGPTFVKLGQLLSTRDDLLPPAYLRALESLQDEAEPIPFEDVEAIVEREIGARIGKAFSRFDPQPLGAASLGQVHRAALRDGREVVVKVQRPGVREAALADLEILEEIAETLDGRLGSVDTVGTVAEFRRTLANELDYRREAYNLARLGDDLERFDRLLIPRPVHDYSTDRVLTMDLVRGRKVTEVGPLVRLETDGAALVDQLYEAYLRQILVEGFFHADPHPGNVFLTEDRRLALIDVGMVAHVDEALRHDLLRVVLAIADGRARDAADAAASLGTPQEDFDAPGYRAAVATILADHFGVPPAERSVGSAVLAVTHACAGHGLLLPTQLSTLGRTLLHLDAVARTLDPDFDPVDCIRRHAGEVLRLHARNRLSEGNVASALLELNELVRALPGRVNRLLDMAAENRLEFRVRTIDEERLLNGLEKIANRIAAGAVIGSLILGAALLMRVETDARVLGYPAFAFILFLVAAIGGAALVVSVARDQWRPRD
jgi:ubiquinone biosynthesis protein